MVVYRSWLQLPICWQSSWFHTSQGRPIQRRRWGGVQQDVRISPYFLSTGSLSWAWFGMLLIQSCIYYCSVQLASLCVVIGIDVLHLAFVGLEWTGIEVAHDISFAFGGNSFGTGDIWYYGGTQWTSFLCQSPFFEIIGPISASDDMKRGNTG